MKTKEKIHKLQELSKIYKAALDKFALLQNPKNEPYLKNDYENVDSHLLNIRSHQ